MAGTQGRLLVLLSLTALLLISSTPVFAATELPPDLRMMRLSDLTIEDTVDGRRLLRFSAVIVNVGLGPLKLEASRNGSSSQMKVQQRIYDDTGVSRAVSTSAKMIFGGDGHTHWHVKNMVRHVVVGIDDTAVRQLGNKRGFCLFDNEIKDLQLPGAPQGPVFTTSNTCNGNISSLSTEMGLSVGWGDKYGFRLPDQYVDITKLNPGRYRLRAIADAGTWFIEADETNNFTYVDFQLNADGTMTVLKYGPSA